MPTISVATTGTEILARNAFRKSLAFKNLDSTNAVHIDNAAPTAVKVATAGIKLDPGGSFTMNISTDGRNTVRDQFSAIAVTSSVNVAVFESYEGVEEPIRVIVIKPAGE